MARKHNTDRNGNSWSEETKRAVWAKGRPINGLPPETWRNDACGTRMNYGSHGDRNSVYGWEIDHIYPVASGGDDRLENLQPLHWQNNLKKGDQLHWQCP